MLTTFDPAYFSGRLYFRELILPGISSSDPSSFAISGLPSVGKTYLLKYLCHPQGARELDQDLLREYRPGGRPDRKLNFVYFDCIDVRADSIWQSLYRAVSETEGERDVMDGTDTAEARKALEQSLKQAHSEGRRLVICLDNLDSVLKSVTSEEETFLRYLTTFAAFVIATEKPLVDLNKDRLNAAGSKKLSSLSPLMQVMPSRSLGLLTDEEAKEFILAPVRVVEQGQQFTEEEVAFLLDVAGPHPFLLTLVCEYVFRLRLDDPGLRDLLSTSNRVRQQVRSQMESLLDVSGHFGLFWEQLGEAEQRTLLKIANGESPDGEGEQLALTDLRKKALIYEDLHEGQYHVFSGLFADYVCRQRPSLRPGRVEEIGVSLPPLDRKLFQYLVAHPGKVCSFEELCERVWKDPNVSKRGVEAAIHRVRARIEEVCGVEWDFIRNVRGVGYKYVPQEL
jgi:GTPase SAR1 family protein